MTQSPIHPDRNLALELVRATEGAAIRTSAWVGRGDKNAADGAAVDAMRAYLGTVSMDGVVIIGEGEKDHAPMLYNGEHVGNGDGPACDVAVDPIDGTTQTAAGRPNAVSVLAVADRGSMYDTSAVYYMDKLVTGPAGKDVCSLELTPEENIRELAKAKQKPVSEITVVVLDRPYHAELMERIRSTGAKTTLILDGDVAGSIDAARPFTNTDMLLGRGGTPEGIITACALKCLGGMIQGRLHPRNEAERQKALAAGHDLDRILTIDDMVTSDNCFFAATGVTDGLLLPGVEYVQRGYVRTHSIVMRSHSGTLRTIEAEHRLDRWF